VASSAAEPKRIPIEQLKASIGKAAYAYYAVFAVMLSSARKSLLAAARPFGFSA